MFVRRKCVVNAFMKLAPGGHVLSYTFCARVNVDYTIVSYLLDSKIRRVRQKWIYVSEKVPYAGKNASTIVCRNKWALADCILSNLNRSH